MNLAMGELIEIWFINKISLKISKAILLVHKLLWVLHSLREKEALVDPRGLFHPNNEGKQQIE